MKKVNAIIERAGDGTYSIYSDADPTKLGYLITGTGHTVEEAKRYFEGSYNDMRRVYKEEGKPFEDVEMVYKYDMASFLEYYTKAFSLAGLSRITGVNQGQLSHYITGRSTPSPKTRVKMQNAIHTFAHDLSNVRFV